MVKWMKITHDEIENTYKLTVGYGPEKIVVIKLQDKEFSALYNMLHQHIETKQNLQWGPFIKMDELLKRNEDERD